MPYTPAQCAKFAMMEKGEAPGTPPKDWRKHCTKAEQDKAVQRQAIRKKRQIKKKTGKRG